MFLDIQNKEKAYVRPTSNSGAWQQRARGHKVDLSLFFERFEQKNNNMDNSFDD